MDESNDRIRKQVREQYASAARDIQQQGCCGPTNGFGSEGYEASDLNDLPEGVKQVSLGCRNPTAVAELREGETVLDLGSGAGLDVLLSARRVGRTGKVYGLDMTDEMLDLARRNQTAAGITNVEFLTGDIESIPLPDASVDVIISNCVMNLSPEKSRVFAESHRVLVPGGRFAVTDVIATRDYEDRADPAAWTGCISGALTSEEFSEGLATAGFHDIDIEVTHEVGRDMVSAIIRATA